MLGCCELCMGENLNSRHKFIIDCCVRKLYIDIAKKRLNGTGDDYSVPIILDFYAILMEQTEEDARNIALSLERFVNGSLNMFIHQQMLMWITV